MQIQRIQTLYLLVAAVVMAVMTFCVPVATVVGNDESAMMTPAFDVLTLVVNAIIFCDMVLTMFLYKKLDLQISLTKALILLLVVSACILYLAVSGVPGASIHYVIPAICYVVMFVMICLAIKGMKADKALLASYDRIR